MLTIRAVEIAYKVCISLKYPLSTSRICSKSCGLTYAREIITKNTQRLRTNPPLRLGSA